MSESNHWRRGEYPERGGDSEVVIRGGAHFLRAEGIAKQYLEARPTSESNGWRRGALSEGGRDSGGSGFLRVEGIEQ